MLRIARTLDVGKGGLYDARSGAVNLWVSPEDHPDSWDGVVMSAGAFPEPREYLGAVELDFELDSDINTCVLELTCTPYERDRATRGGVKRRVGEHPEPTEDEWAWLTAKVDALVDLAERVVEPPDSETGIFCKLCEKVVKVSLLNDYLTHLTEEHQVKITSVVLGEQAVVHTNMGPIEV